MLTPQHPSALDVSVRHSGRQDGPWSRCLAYSAEIALLTSPRSKMFTFRIIQMQRVDLRSFQQIERLVTGITAMR